MTSPGTMPGKIGEVGGHKKKAREGSSTPVMETPVVGTRADVRPRVMDNGGEGMRSTTDEGIERGIHEVVVNEGVCARKSEHDITKEACAERAKRAERVFLRAKRQHRWLRRTSKWRA